MTPPSGPGGRKRGTLRTPLLKHRRVSLALPIAAAVLSFAGVAVSQAPAPVRAPLRGAASAAPTIALSASSPSIATLPASQMTRLPIRGGYVLTHEHPTQGMAFGGNYAFAGPTSNYRNGVMVQGYTMACGGCSPGGAACDHGEVKGNVAGSVSSLGRDIGPHASHKGPRHDSFSHLRYSTDWVRSAFDPPEPALRDTRMKIMVAFAVESEAMCEQLYYANKGKGGAGGDGFPCSQGDSFASLKRQLDAIKAWVSENGAWMEIARTAADARRIVNANKLAIVLGVESDYAFGAENATFDPVARLNEYHSMGVRTFYLAHKVNSRLSGADVYMPKDSDPGKAIRAMQAIAGCFYYDDNVGPFPLVNDQGHNFCQNSCGPNHFKGNKLGGLTDNCASKLSQISEVNLSDYILLRGAGRFNGFGIYPRPPGFTTAGNSVGGGTSMIGNIERNNLGLSHDGERVVREAMRKGMIVNIDHTSSRARTAIHGLATQSFGGYPLNALHNNPNSRLVGKKGETPFPHEYDFDDAELGLVRQTGGFFGVRLGPVNSAEYEDSGVTADCPRTSTETAKILAYLLDQGLKVGYSLDFATVTQGVHSRTLRGCGTSLGVDHLHKYGSEIAEGLSHVGMMKHFHKELETIRLKNKYLEQLKNDGVEAFVAMWEKSEAKASSGTQIPRQTFPSNVSVTPSGCTSDSGCSSGQFCTTGIVGLPSNACRPKNPRGTPCVNKRQCASDRCSWAVCADADECRSNSDCSAGQYCADPIASKASCKALLANGKACTRSRQCASNRCAMFVCKP